jgi:cob(I)alamin adenosyltransferase
MKEIAQWLQPNRCSERVVVYLNRLSDCRFVLARSANAHSPIADVAWHSPRQQQRKGA